MVCRKGSGVLVTVGEGVAVAVGNGVRVSVAVAITVGVGDGVGVAVSVGVGVAVAVAVSVAVGVAVGEGSVAVGKTTWVAAGGVLTRPPLAESSPPRLVHQNRPPIAKMAIAPRPTSSGINDLGRVEAGKTAVFSVPPRMIVGTATPAFEATVGSACCQAANKAAGVAKRSAGCFANACR